MIHEVANANFLAEIARRVRSLESQPDKWKKWGTMLCDVTTNPVAAGTAVEFCTFDLLTLCCSSRHTGRSMNIGGREALATGI
jgi:hypothetical protein